MSRNRLKYLVFHCTATREGQNITGKDVLRWHLAPKDLAGGGVLYRGKTYASRAALPNEFIGGLNIRGMHGRGWSVPGYSYLVHLDGLIESLHHHDDDQFIDSWEITNGAKGINSVSRHLCYAGGLDKDGRPKDTRTPEQMKSLATLAWSQLEKAPDIILAGHNQFSAKACPSFDVPHWALSIGIPNRNVLIP